MRWKTTLWSNPTHKRTAVLLAGALLTCVVALAAWYRLGTLHNDHPAGLPPSGDALREPKGGIGITNLIADKRPTWVYGGFPLCVAEGKGVTLTRIVLHKARGVELVAGGVRLQPEDGGGTDTDPPPGMRGAQIVTGPGRDPGDSGLRFTLSCDEDSAEVLLRLRRTGSGRGSIAGYAVIYSDSGKQRSAYYQAKILLCPRADEAPGCEDELP